MSAASLLTLGMCGFFLCMPYVYDITLNPSKLLNYYAVIDKCYKSSKLQLIKLS
jgi:hypothetical protein